MEYYSIECEAPGGGYGPAAAIDYDSQRISIKQIRYLDLIFDVWLGGELVQDVGCFCVTVALWDFLKQHDIQGVSVRPMDVTLGEHVNDMHPGRVIPQFLELVIPRTARGRQADGWILDAMSIPKAEMFTGVGIPLIVTRRVKDLICSYPVSGIEYQTAKVRNTVS